MEKERIIYSKKRIFVAIFDKTFSVDIEINDKDVEEQFTLMKKEIENWREDDKYLIRILSR